ncbi:MAG: hypothetical protein Q7S00_00685, partial [bacterium]|nr:hypothetical protein [bacterium]
LKMAADLVRAPGTAESKARGDQLFSQAIMIDAEAEALLTRWRNGGGSGGEGGAAPVSFGGGFRSGPSGGGLGALPFEIGVLPSGVQGEVVSWETLGESEAFLMMQSAGVGLEMLPGQGLQRPFGLEPFVDRPVEFRPVGLLH